jgi:hypothetical protein
MIDDGLFLDDAEPFSVLLERCRVIQEKVNADPKSSVRQKTVSTARRLP